MADTYAEAAPDLIGILRNVTTTSRTVLEKRQQLDVFFGDLAGLADTSTRILSDNETNLIRVGEVTEPDPPAAGHLLAGVPLPDQGPGAATARDWPRSSTAT